MKVVTPWISSCIISVLQCVLPSRGPGLSSIFPDMIIRHRYNYDQWDCPIRSDPGETRYIPQYKHMIITL